MRSAASNEKVTEGNLDAICRELSLADPRLGLVYEKYGAPPLWAREPSFETLIHIILEQQVSLASALAAFNKLREAVGRITPEAILSMTDKEMKASYFSRQKAVYARELAAAILEGRLVLNDLESLEDDEIRHELMKVKGIGRWTSDIFLLMCLLRPDVMPVGDIALHAAWKKIADLAERPRSDEFSEISKRWKPYRSVAARLLWHFYLSERSNR
jgi:DNA-3-methyladenine glycosylase II